MWRSGWFLCLLSCTTMLTSPVSHTGREPASDTRPKTISHSRLPQCTTLTHQWSTLRSAFPSCLKTCFTKLHRRQCKHDAETSSIRHTSPNRALMAETEPNESMKFTVWYSTSKLSEYFQTSLRRPRHHADICLIMPLTWLTQTHLFAWFTSLNHPVH